MLALRAGNLGCSPDVHCRAGRGFTGLRAVARCTVHFESRPYDTNRDAYFRGALSCHHLFLDPDTGLRLRPTRGVGAPEYLFLSELLRLATTRPNALTIVFDQSVRRGSERLDVDGKLRELRHSGVSAFAYISHACFIVAATDTTPLAHARTTLLAASRLPQSRFHDRTE
jgi:hypothetical protein